MILWTGSARLFAQTDGGREKRTITYDARWELHDYDPGFSVGPDTESVAGSRLDEARKQRSIGERRDPVANIPSPASIPPSQRRTYERESGPSSRNWILPTLEGGLSAQSEEEPNEPTGWGWLADEVEQRRLEREEARLAEQAAEEEQAESEELLRPEEDDASAAGQEADGFGTGWVEDAAVGGNGPAGADALASLAVQDVEIQDALSQAVVNAIDANEPYGNADPWGNEEASMSPWAVREAEDSTWGFGESAFGDTGLFENSSERTQPRFGASRVESESSRSYTATDAGGGMIARPSAGALENRFGQGVSEGLSGGRTDYAPGSAFEPSESRSDWGGSWTSESGWSGSQPVSANTDVSRSLSTPRPPVRNAVDSSSFRHNDSWLADPGP